jgi:hypothetical protein
MTVPRCLSVSFWLCLLATAACTRPNPDFCCVTEADCATQGVQSLRPCADDRVCDQNTCRRAECATSGECSAASEPYCVDRICRATCREDANCVGTPQGPMCAADGVCVGCESNAECPATAPVCDPAKRACVPCRADADCASGVCLAADGVCAASTELIYVSNDGVDGGACNKGAPCRTFAYALSNVTAARAVIRLLGAFYEAPDGVSISSGSVTIDGEGTEIRKSTNGSHFTFSGTSRVTLEGVKFQVGSGQEGITITSPGLTRVSQIEATGRMFQNAVLANDGTVRITDSQFVSVTVLCGKSNIELARDTFTTLSIDGGSNCVTHLSRSVLRDVQLNAGGVLRADNNLVISTSPTCTNDFSASITNIRFNTWVCRHSPPVSGEFVGRAFACGNGDVASSNLFAWDSTNPTLGCTNKYSMFPSFAAAAAASGIQNRTADPASLFVDYLGGNFHLSSNSAAKGGAEPRTGTTTDLDGNPRPAPNETDPDIGAFESP